jgi:nucleoside 2-deoxyribosyltransferase
MTRPVSVYIAGSSDSMTRVDWARESLTALGIRVTSTWPDNVRKVGGGNPRDASDEQRADWTQVCLDEILAADLLWFVVPSPGVTRGAWAELGYAHALGKPIVCSGDTKQSIFCALSHEYATDAEALGFVNQWSGCQRLIESGRVAT